MSGAATSIEGLLRILTQRLPEPQVSVSEVRIIAIRDVPEIRPGDDLARLLRSSFQFQDRDVLVLAQKIVSKAEGRLIALDDVRVTERARELAAITDKDGRIVQLILDESNAVLRARPGALIVEDRRGWICANAGIDRSNIPQTGAKETVSLLPLDPDTSAKNIRDVLLEEGGVTIGVVIADSHGRAWREGTVGVAIGAAGIEALSDRRGSSDRLGYRLQHTIVGTADELAAAASLMMGQGDESRPAVVIRGLDVDGDGKARDLQRPGERDLFR